MTPNNLRPSNNLNDYDPRYLNLSNNWRFRYYFASDMNNQNCYFRLLRYGLGIACIPRFDCKPLTQISHLNCRLEQVKVSQCIKATTSLLLFPLNVCLVYPNRRHRISYRSTLTKCSFHYCSGNTSCFWNGSLKVSYQAVFRALLPWPKSRFAAGASTIETSPGATRTTRPN